MTLSHEAARSPGTSIVGGHPVVIAGMHRSGTSLVARMLYDCGLHLGDDADLLPPDPDNTEGFWENVRFVEINDRVLEIFGGAWDMPPEFPKGWERKPELEPVRKQASELIQTFDETDRWGWKDPRTCLTLPFWTDLLSDLHVIICVRHPLEVARSLTRRGATSEALGLQLWARYTRSLLDAVEGSPHVVTHFDAYFRKPESELRRLLEALELRPSEATITWAASRVNEFARHQRADDIPGASLSTEVSALYDRLRGDAGPIYAGVSMEAAVGAEASDNRPAPQEAGRSVPLPAPTTERCRYTHFDDSPDSTHHLVVSLVPEGARVLEFGCATGYMSRVLRDEKGCAVTGVELSEEAAQEAKAICERVIVGDAELLDFDDVFEGAFDVVLLADFLEHLRDPAALLHRVRPFVAEGGIVVASIPNVAHGSVRLALLEGEFRYRALGLLDETHLRFFTRATIEDLFESSGYVVTDWHRRHIALDQTEIRSHEASPNVRQQLGRDPDATTYQFVIRAVPSDASRRLAATRALLAEARGHLEALWPLRREVEEQRVELEAAHHELAGLRPLRGVDKEVDALRRSHEALSRRLVAERAAMVDQVDDLVEQLERAGEEARVMRQEIEWRKEVALGLEEANEWLRGVSERLEEEIAALQRSVTALQTSRSFRYTAPLRMLARPFRRRV